MGESIHIHYGAIRVSLTIKEFEQFYRSVRKAVEELLFLEDIETNQMEEAMLVYIGANNGDTSEGDTNRNGSFSNQRKALERKIRGSAHRAKIKLLTQKKEIDRKKNAQSMPSLNDVTFWMEHERIAYYLLEHSTVLDDTDICCSVIVSDLKKVGRKYNLFVDRGYEGYDILYSISAPMMLQTLDGRVMISECLCCKSRFEKDILPLDKYCNHYAWNHVYTNEKGIRCADPNTVLLYLITTSMLEKLAFSEEDKEYVTHHLEHLDDIEMQKMMKRVFFCYSDLLIKLLKSSKYEEAVEKYVSFIDY